MRDSNYHITGLRFILILTGLLSLSFQNASQPNDDPIIQIADSLLQSGNTEEVLALYRQSHKDGKLTGKSLAILSEKLGDFYRTRSAPEKAYEFYLTAIDNYENLKKQTIAGMKAGSVCGMLEQYDPAIFHFSAALKTALLLSDSTLIAQGYNNLGLSFLRQKNYNEAKRHLRSSLNIRSAIEAEADKVAIVINNLGLVHEKTEDYDSALFFYRRSYQLRKNANTDNDALAQSLQNIGYIKQKQYQPDSAAIYYNHAKNLIKHSNDHNLRRKIYGNLMELFWEEKNYDSARYYLDKFTAIDKQFYDEETSKELINLNAKYKVAEKDEEIDSLGQRLSMMIGQRNLLIAGVFLVLFTALLLFLIFWQRQRTQRKIARQNEEILHARIDELLKDEEIKSINAMLEGQEQERKRIAEDLHDRLGSKLSAVKLHFESIREKTDDKVMTDRLSLLIDESVTDVRAIAHNMLSGVLDKFGLVAALKDLSETLNLSDKLNVRFISHGIDDRLPGELELNLYRIIQELIANVMKHARATEVIIQLNKFEDELVMTVEDDGIGFDLAGHRSGVGLKNIASRVDKIDGKFHIDSGMNNGTSITIEISGL